MTVTLHRGKLAKAPVILSVRALTRDDLARLRQARTQPRVKVLRDSHHRLARLVASGARNEEILRVTGYSGSRLASLKIDPAFQQLVEEYRGKVTEAFIASQDEFYETSTSNMLRAERMIEEHLDNADETGELIGIKTLLAITSDRADRFGYPKKKVSENFNHDFARRMEQIMASRGKATVIGASGAPALAPPLQDLTSPGDPEGDPSVAVSAGFRRRL